MKKIYAILLLLVVIMSIVGCKQAAEQNTGNEAEEQTVTGSLESLMERSTPMKCTWDVSVQGESASGVLFVKGEKFRSEVSVPEGTMYSLSDGEYMYSWSDLQEQGIKMNLEKLEEMGGEMETETPETEELHMQNLDTEYNYRCTPWVVTESNFVPPSDVEFMDYTAMMEQMHQMAEDLEQGNEVDPCSYCDMLPEDSRADCLANC